MSHADSVHVKRVKVQLFAIGLRRAVSDNALKLCYTKTRHHKLPDVNSPLKTGSF